MVEVLEAGARHQGLLGRRGMGVLAAVAGPLRRVEVLKYQEGAMKVVEGPPGAVKRTSSSWCE